MSEVEITKEALMFAQTVVSTKAIAGIVIVGSIVMDVHGGIPQILQGGREWERNIAAIVEQYAQQREHAAYERGKAEGAEAERGRCLAILNAQMQTATISEERAVEGGWFQNAQMHEAKANALKEAMDAIQPIDINQE